MKKILSLTILIFIVTFVLFISGCKGGEENNFEPSGDKINVTINSNSTHSLYWAYNNLDYAIGNETIYQMLEGKAFVANQDESSFDFLIEFDEQAPNTCPLYYVKAMTKKDGKIVAYDNQIDKNEIISDFLFEDGKISFHASLKDKIPSGVMYIFVVSVRFNDTHEGNIYIGITGANKDTQNTDTDTNQDSVGELYAQINGGKFLGTLDETIITISPTTINYSPYRLINTYDELVQLAENASDIDSSIFEENAILFIRQRYPHIEGEPLGYRDLKIEDSELFITYSKYEYRLGLASTAVAYYKDYIVIPKNELPDGIEQSGKISVILKPIVLEHIQDINEVGEQTAILDNTAWLFKTREEVDAFIASYGIDKRIYPDSEEFVIAIYLRRPQKIDYKYESDITSQGYLCKKDGSTLNLTYLYDEFKCGEMGYYIDFISIPSEMVENVETINVDLKARENPAFPEGEI